MIYLFTINFKNDNVKCRWLISIFIFQVEKGYRFIHVPKTVSTFDFCRFATIRSARLDIKGNQIKSGNLFLFVESTIKSRQKPTATIKCSKLYNLKQYSVKYTSHSRQNMPELEIDKWHEIKNFVFVLIWHWELIFVIELVIKCFEI